MPFHAVPFKFWRKVNRKWDFMVSGQENWLGFPPQKQYIYSSWMIISRNTSTCRAHAFTTLHHCNGWCWWLQRTHRKSIHIDCFVYVLHDRWEFRLIFESTNSLMRSWNRFEKVIELVSRNKNTHTEHIEYKPSFKNRQVLVGFPNKCKKM